jgi:hypothetical protein
MFNIQLGAHDLRVDSWEGNATLADFRHYGDWTDRKDGRFFVPGLLSGSDYSGSLVERSNHKAFEEAFSRGENKWWKTVYGGHGTFAVVIDLKKVPKKRETELKDFFNALENYPLADEDLHSNMEIEAQDEAWKSWARGDFKKALEKHFGFTFDEVDDEKVFELFQRASDRANEYWINEQGGDMWIDVEKVVKKGKITENDIDDLGATFSTEEFKDNGPGLYIVHGSRPRHSEEERFDNFESAEEGAYDVLGWYRDNAEGTFPSIQVIEADSREDAVKGRGHVWWQNGVTRGPAVSPRQAGFSFHS